MTVLLLAAALLAGGWWVRTSYAASTPGSSADPVVTKSYVDNKFNSLNATLNQILTQLGGAAAPGTAPGSGPQPTPSIALPTSDDSAIVSDVVAQIEFLYGDVLRGGGTSATTVPAKDGGISSFTPVSAVAGQIILGGEGTEIILRSGAAVGYTEVKDGIVNASSGTDVKTGQAIKPNQLHIVPRDDGRGVQVTKDAWFIIKGSYQIIN